jgi:hypothetical protein
MKNRILISFLFAILTTICQAQGNMYIIQKSGVTLVVPISNIDSITHHATLPIISTVDISNITYVSAASGGFIKANGGAPVTARGVCWSTTPNPTISGNKTVDGSGSGSFTSSLTGLSSNTTYYVRSYATNSVGTAYGVEKSFTCLSDYLSTLSLKSGDGDIALSPEFIKTTNDYSATVKYEESSLTVTPVAENVNSAITVNGVSVASGASSTVNLSVGPNTIAVTVYNNGTVQQEYNINVIRMGDSRLSSLEVDGGTGKNLLDSEFKPENREYRISVDYDVDAVTVTPTAVSSTSTIRLETEYDKSDIVSGTTSDPIPLKVGESKIFFVVDDYGEQLVYDIMMTRRTSSGLSSLIINHIESNSALPLNPSFSRTNLGYTAELQSTQSNKFQINATLEDPNADITYTLNGEMVYTSIVPEYPDGQVHVVIEPDDPNKILALIPGQNVLLITVIPSDGGSPRVYTFNITY